MEIRMNDIDKKLEAELDDEAFKNAPLQWTADKLAELVNVAEKDPGRQITISLRTVHKIYMAYLGVLDVYQEHIAAGTLINGQHFSCSVQLRDAIAPIMAEHRYNQAEKDVLQEIEKMRAEENDSKKAPLRKDVH